MTQSVLRIPFPRKHVVEAYRMLDTFGSYSTEAGYSGVLYEKLNVLYEAQSVSRPINRPLDYLEVTVEEWQWLRYVAAAAIGHVEASYAVPQSTLPDMRVFLAMLNEYALPAAILPSL